MFRKWTLKKHIIFSVFIVLLTILIDYVLYRRAVTSSIGIIGGADGPTVMFTITSSQKSSVLLGKYCLVFIIIMFLFKPLKNILIYIFNK